MASNYAPAGDEMDAEAYGAPVTKPGEDAGATKEQPSVDQENAMSDTALVPNKVLSPDGEPLQEGEEIVLVVVKNHGDESEVKYAPKKGGDTEGTDEGETPGNEEAELSALDQKGY